MSNRPMEMIGLLDQGLAVRWKQAEGRLSKFLASVGLARGEHSQSLYIFPATPLDPIRYLRDIETHLEDTEQWAELIGSRDPDNTPMVLAFPVSRKVRLKGSPDALGNAVLALYVEVHSRLVGWWLINAWRSRQLAEATWHLADALQTIPAATCARSLVETAASVFVETKNLQHLWSEIKIDCAANGPDVSHWHRLTLEIYKMVWGNKFDNRVPDLQKIYGALTRSNILTQIEKLARATDDPLQIDYQWLCNAVHPSIGGMLSFAAPMMGHESKAYAFQWVCDTPTSFRPIRIGGNEHHLLADAAAFLASKDADTAATPYSGPEVRERTIQDAIARVATLAVDVLEKTLDGALRIIDDVGLTTKAPATASFRYWRNLTKGHGNASCPCRSGRKARSCPHRWTEPSPTIVEGFHLGSNGY